VGCHPREGAAWETSDHRHAWAAASPSTVLGDFSNAVATHAGIESRFERSDDGFFAVTDGPDGTLQRFRVTHTFGRDPLQQYLVEFPAGRYQALPFAWDTRAATSGGQRWFHLYPDERLDSSDPLHWTRWLQNWNSACADCHATHLEKGFDAATGGYATRFAEGHVGCEACHGPGSGHAADPAGVRLPDLTSAHAEIDVCAPCHSRRSQLRDGFRAGDPWLDYYLPALPLPPLYQVDGQILDEVFEYGSFLQSRMSAAGVRCSDCHDPHSARLRTEGNAVCTRCHNERPPERFAALAGRGIDYDSTGHHFHTPGSAAAACVACHMPARTYMGVDSRRDHSFRVPRPDLSARFGVDNACTGCHTDRSAQWAVAEIARRFGSVRRGHPGEVLAAASRGFLSAEPALAALAGDTTAAVLSRGAALALLAGYRRGYSADAIKAGLASSEPLVALAAIGASDRLPPEVRWRLVSPLLSAPLLALRAEAGRVLADRRNSLAPGPDLEALDAAIADYLATQTFASDWPSALTNIGVIQQRLGHLDEAERAWLEAIAIEPEWPAARVNLADLYRATGRDAEGGPQLLRAAASPLAGPGAHHALGLWLVRHGRHAEALASLARAAEPDDAETRFVYVYAVALADAGRREDGIEVLRKRLERYPEDVDLIELLSLLLRDAGRLDEALEVANAWLRVLPGDARAAGLVESLAAAGASMR